MKKVIYGMMFSCCLNLFGMDNPEQTEQDSEEFVFSRAVMLEHEGTNVKFSYDYTLNADQAIVSYMVSQQFKPEGEFRGMFSDKQGNSYPCTRSLVRLSQVDEHHSLAIYKLTVDIDKLKGIVLDDNYTDTGNLLEHQTREISCVHDNGALVTRRTHETFVSIGGEDRSINTYNSDVPYTWVGEYDFNGTFRRHWRNGDGIDYLIDYPYQTREIGCVHDDGALVTRRTYETFLNIDGGERSINTYNSDAPYACSENHFERVEDTRHHIQIVGRTYTRGDGSTFYREQIYNDYWTPGGVSNEFERLGHFLAKGARDVERGSRNCNVH